MTLGGCLCGGVRFEVERFAGPFELCHCSRCRKTSGSAFAAMVGVRRAEFRWLAGQELVEHFDAPLLHHPPPYRSSFCRRCGSPVPDPADGSDWFEIAAGLLDPEPDGGRDEAPGIRPDRHIFAEHRAEWSRGLDDLPELDREALIALRRTTRESGGD